MNINVKELELSESNTKGKTISIIVIVASSTLAIVCLLLAFVLSEHMAIIFGIFASLAMIAITQLVNHLLARNPCKFVRRLCERYQMALCEKGVVAGVVTIYPKRKDTDDEKSDYYNDLLKEFQILSQKSIPEDSEPVKMIGVALEFYFGGNTNDTEQTELSKLILEISKKKPFHVLLCDEANNELEERLTCVKLITKEHHKNNLKKREKIEKLKIKDSPIENSIKGTKDKIDDLIENEAKIKIKSYHYSHNATIIIVNDSIFYTPGIMDFNNYVKLEEDIPLELRCDKELSLRIDRRSDYGKRLETLYKSLWLAAEDIIYPEKCNRKDICKKDFEGKKSHSASQGVSSDNEFNPQKTDGAISKISRRKSKE